MSVAPLMLRCPKTGLAIPTGIAMDPESFESSGFQNNSSYCPTCRESHPWSKENVFFGDSSIN